MKKITYKASKTNDGVNLTPIIDNHIAINLRVLFRILLWFDSENVMTVKQIKDKFLSKKKNKDITWPMAESALQRLTNEFNYLKFAEHSPGSDLNTFCLEPLGEEKITDIINGSVSRANHGRQRLTTIAIWFSVIGVIANTCFTVYKSISESAENSKSEQVLKRLDSLQSKIILLESPQVK